MCSRCTADNCGWNRGLQAGDGVGRSLAQTQALSPLFSSAARGRSQFPSQPGETGRGKVGGELAPSCPVFLPGDWLSLHCPPPGARTTAAASREARGEGEPGTGGGKFAEPAIPVGGGMDGEWGRGLSKQFHDNHTNIHMVSHTCKHTHQTYNHIGNTHTHNGYFTKQITHVCIHMR